MPESVFRRRTPILQWVVSVALMFLAIAPIDGRAESPSESLANLSCQQIIDRAIERSERQLQSGSAAQFEAWVSSVVQSLDSEGAVTDEEKSLLRRYPIKGAVYEELVKKQGQALSDKEAQKEKKKIREFEREVAKRIEEKKPPQPESDRSVVFDREFVSRYQFELSGQDTIGSHECWVISFVPREGKLPVRRRMDEALNNSRGRIWVAREDYGIVKVEFSLIKPIRYLWGLLATVRDTQGVVHLKKIEPDVWLLSNFELDLDLRVLIKNIRRRITREWTEYRRIEPGSGHPIQVTEAPSQH